jgi:hypothetical protein
LIPRGFTSYNVVVWRKGAKMNSEFGKQIQKIFESLPPEEREAIISHGVTIVLSNLKKRVFLAESKVRYFEGKYNVSLADLDTNGIPDDADLEMHEDYVMWHHWDKVAQKIKKEIVSLEEIAQQGLSMGEFSLAGY